MGSKDRLPNRLSGGPRFVPQESAQTTPNCQDTSPSCLSCPSPSPFSATPESQETISLHRPSPILGWTAQKANTCDFVIYVHWRLFLVSDVLIILDDRYMYSVSKPFQTCIESTTNKAP